MQENINHGEEYVGGAVYSLSFTTKCVPVISMSTYENAGNELRLSPNSTTNLSGCVWYLYNRNSKNAMVSPIKFYIISIGY